MQFSITVYTATIPGSGPFGSPLGSASCWLWGLEALSGGAEGDAILSGRAMPLLHKALERLTCHAVLIVSTVLKRPVFVRGTEKGSRYMQLSARIVLL